jgi:protein translocase SecG subunit
MNIFQILMYVLHFTVSLVLIALVVSQTSKSEGLGAIGGSSGPSLRGRAGMDEQLSTYTKYAAVAFMILSLLIYVLGSRFGWH